MKNQALSVIFSALILGWAVTAQAYEDATCIPGDVLDDFYDDVTVRSPDPSLDEGPPYGDCLLVGATVNGDVEVQDNAELQVTNGSRIHGSIYVETDASLSVNFLSVIEGSVHGNGAASVSITQATIEKDLSLYDSKDDSGCQSGSTILGNVAYVGNKGRMEIIGCNITGNVLASMNTGGVEIRDNKEISDPGIYGNIAGNVELFKNTDNTGGNTMIITNNKIEGNVKCKKNDPEPTDVRDGGEISEPNDVDGNAAAQCEDLVFQPNP